MERVYSISFENIAELNMWSSEGDQAESYAYGMPLIVQRDYCRLKEKIKVRFGHSALKERFVTEAKLKKRQPNESLRDFGQAIEDLYRRAYPDNPEILKRTALNPFSTSAANQKNSDLLFKGQGQRPCKRRLSTPCRRSALGLGRKTSLRMVDLYNDLYMRLEMM